MNFKSSAKGLRSAGQGIGPITVITDRLIIIIIHFPLILMAAALRQKPRQGRAGSRLGCCLRGPPPQFPIAPSMEEPFGL